MVTDVIRSLLFSVLLFGFGVTVISCFESSVLVIV